MVRGNHIIKDAQSVAFFRFEEPTYPGSAVTSEFEKKFLFMTPVCNVPGVSGQEVPLGSGHGRFSSRLCLNGYFRHQK